MFHEPPGGSGGERLLDAWVRPARMHDAALATNALAIAIDDDRMQP